MKKVQAADARQIVRLERAAVILERFHHELQALPASPRLVRLLRANRAAVTKVAQKTEEVRTRLRATVTAPPDAPPHDRHAPGTLKSVPRT